MMMMIIIIIIIIISSNRLEGFSRDGANTMYMRSIQFPIQSEKKTLYSVVKTG